MTCFFRTMMGITIGVIFVISVSAEGLSPLQVLPKATPTPMQEPTSTPIPFPTSIADATGFPEWNNRTILYTFSKASAEENEISIQGAGFGTYPQADVSFGYLPTDNAFEGATDGQGIIIQADPGEGAMIFGKPIEDTQSALIRCSVRADQPHALVTIASIGSAPDRFIAVNYPDDVSYFMDRYMRLQTFCIPPSAGFQPVIQVVNTSETETLTVYLDNFDVYFIDPNKYYSGNFLDGDEIDPPASLISIPNTFDEKSFSPGLLEFVFGFWVEPSLDNTSIIMGWRIRLFNANNVFVRRSTDNLNWDEIFIFPGDLNIVCDEYIDRGLKPNTKYYYYISCSYSHGPISSPIYEVTTRP